MPRTPVLRIFILGVVIAAIAGVAQARNTSSGPYKTPCRDDRLRLCSAAKPGKAGKCLKQHMDDLSPACKTFLKNKG